MFYGSQFEINEEVLSRMRKVLLISGDSPKHVYTFQNMIDDLHNKHAHIETESSYIDDYLDTVLPLAKKFVSRILKFWSDFPDAYDKEDYVNSWIKNFNVDLTKYRTATDDVVPIIHYVYQYYCNREDGLSPLGRVLGLIGKYAAFVKVIVSTFYMYDNTEYNNTIYVHEDCDRLLMSDRVEEETLRSEFLLMNLYDIVRPSAISKGELTPMYKLNVDHVKYRYDLLRAKRNQPNTIRGPHPLHSHTDPLIDEYYSDSEDEDSSDDDDGIPVMNEDELEERFSNPELFITQLSHM